MEDVANINCEACNKNLLNFPEICISKILSGFLSSVRLEPWDFCVSVDRIVTSVQRSCGLCGLAAGPMGQGASLGGEGILPQKWPQNEWELFQWEPFFFFGKIDEDRDNKNDCVQELFVFFFLILKLQVLWIVF